MQNGMLTKESLLDRLAADDRLPSIAERCGFLSDLLRYRFLWGRVSISDYESFLQGRCARDFPLAEVLKSSPLKIGQ